MTNNIISEISLSVVHLKSERILMTIIIHINIQPAYKKINN